MLGSVLAAIVSICVSRKTASHSRGRGSNNLLSALVRVYPVVTEPLRLVGFKQGSGKIIFAFHSGIRIGGWICWRQDCRQGDQLEEGHCSCLVKRYQRPE